MPDRPDNRSTPQPSDAGVVRDAAHETADARPTSQHLDTDALSAFIDARLEGDLNLAAAGHIAACPDCRGELAELRATVGLLGGLPQYRPRRSFALGAEYAHPVRTSRLARLLPVLPVLRAAAVAVLLLLVGVGAADILTQIGEDSGDSTRPAAMSDQAPGDTAMQLEPGAADPDDARVPAANSAPAGDGMGGDGFPSRGESESTTAESSVSQDEEVPGGEAAGDSATDNDAASGAEFDAMDEAPADAPISAAAPRSAQEATSREAATGDADAESALDADDASESDAEGAGADISPSDPAANESVPAAPAGAVVANDDGRGAADAAAAPTVAIAAEIPAPTANPALAQADTSGTTRERAGFENDAGISNWRLIEVVLAVVLVALVVLVVALGRLNTRVRRIGVIR